MSDSDKSKKELIAELEALRSKLGGKQAEDPVTEAEDTSRGGLTRRDILATAWVAPVILTVPLGAAVSQRAHAQGTEPTNCGTIDCVEPTMGPTQTPPTPEPTQVPQTPQPTQVPQTPQPTQVPQTPQPTQVPQTPQPTQTPTSAPTAPPTAFPTASAGVIPVEISDFDIS